MGNRVTATRWARLLRDLGHQVRITERLTGSPDVLIALHARKSAKSAATFKERFPDRPLVVALTGTDLYDDLVSGNRAAIRTVDIADHLVVLNAEAVRNLSAVHSRKAHLIYQSADVPAVQRKPPTGRFDVCVLAHLRPVKDPLRTAMASRLAPLDSQLRVRHLGRTLDERLEIRALAESNRNPRYEFSGELPRGQALKILAGSHLLVLSSRMEGGANAIGEAAVLGVPILATNAPGNLGLLGARHPGYFEYRDTKALAKLLLRAETDSKFYSRLKASSDRAAPRFAPKRELKAWSELCSGFRSLG
ncbi:MAG: putative glycosyltransferase (TIGR04348 family) [Planctomycetota bacterium]|jgi:putative glycosyltransferase (TIGR04348 family)